MSITGPDVAADPAREQLLVSDRKNKNNNTCSGDHPPISVPILLFLDVSNPGIASFSGLSRTSLPGPTRFSFTRRRLGLEDVNHHRQERHHEPAGPKNGLLHHVVKHLVPWRPSGDRKKKKTIGSWNYLIE